MQGEQLFLDDPDEPQFVRAVHLLDVVYHTLHCHSLSEDDLIYVNDDEESKHPLAVKRVRKATILT